MLASRVGLDTAGGVITGGGQSFVTIGGLNWAIVGDAVADHAHTGATMAQGSALVRINGIAVCRAGDLATCGDPATGSGFVSAD